MSLTTQAAILAAWPAQVLPIAKGSPTSGLNQNQGVWMSYWTQAGYPVAGAVPAVTGGAGAQCTRLTTGALLFNNPASGFSYLARAVLSTLNFTLPVLLFDRLSAAAGLSGTVVTEQDFNTGIGIPTRASATGVRIFMEVYTALGATASTVTANYDDIDGTNYTSDPVTVPASMGAGTMLEIPLRAGTKGVKTLYGATLSVSTGTAGNWGVTLARQLTSFTLADLSRTAVFSELECGLTRVPNDACLWFVTPQPFSVARPIVGSLALVQG